MRFIAFERLVCKQRELMSVQILRQTNKIKWSVVVAQLTARSVSNTRRLEFESSHRKLLLNIYLLLTVCRKDENKEKKRPGIYN